MFGKKEKKTVVTDRVYISSAAKETGIKTLINQVNNLLLICWFEGSFDKAKTIVENRNAEVMLAREVQPHHIHDKQVLFLEHYPVLKKDKELLQRLKLGQAIFYSALDEPIFQYFGGDKIIQLAEKMGMQSNEALEHKLISASIQNAQEKIENRVQVEITARSQEEWFEKNLKV